jgi:hypothetical protein
MQEDPVGAVIGLTAPDNQLAILNSYAQVFFGKACHSKRDPIRSVRSLFNVKRRIAFVSSFGGAFNKTLQLFETQHMGVRPQGQFAHQYVLNFKRRS